MLWLKPPVGHAWTFYGQGAQTRQCDVDEQVPIGPGFRYAGEVIGRASLDAGSGNLLGIAT